VNGRVHRVDAEPGDNLLTILRDDLGLTGSKYGCGEGQCGSCTVFINREPARACVTRISAVADQDITTIEAIAAGDQLHPVQQAFLDAEAFQCGYCTPGLVMATIALLRTTPDPSEQDIARLMDRSLCRCGVYPRIVRAVRLAATQTRQPSSAADKPGDGR
jgi:nicotinate dehydrogenase subunit A